MHCGFLPFEGCFEHSFLMQSLLDDSKRRNKNLRIVWFDLKNVFGSVPQNKLFEMMERLSVPPAFISLCQDIYQNSTFKIRTASGYTNPIPQTMGVKQGCPLSPLLFNLAIQGMLIGLDTVDAGYKLPDGSSIKYMAYADDLCIVDNDIEGINAMIHKIEEFSNWAQLQFNTSKCASLSMMNSKSRKYVESFSPKLNNQHIPALKWEERYKYLGIKVGREKMCSLAELKQEIISDSELIGNSLLAPWQKVEAINMFVISKAQYHLRASTPFRTWAQSIDKKLRNIIKSALKLPRRTTNSFLYTANRYGGLGLYSMEDNLDVARITQFFKCLTSPDDIVKQCAWTQLSQVVGKRLKKQDISPQDMESFLNSPRPPNEGSRGDIQSLWSIVRKSLHRLRILVSVTDSNSIELDLSGSTITAIRRKLLSKLVRKEVQNLRLEELISHQDQGRTFPLVSKSPASNHWVGTGHHVTFADHRFGIRARTNLLPVKSVLKRMRKTTVDTCPKCKQQPETLGHVLNSCPANAGLMRERHNLILKRLSNATRSENGTNFLDQKIPNSPGCLRPDLVITTAHSITIVDVTIPFKASQDAFTKARSEKTQKYSELFNGRGPNTQRSRLEL